MSAFTFHFLQQGGEARAFDVRVCASEQNAWDVLPTLFDEHSSCTSIEIWHGAEKLCTTTRDPAQRRPARGGVLEKAQTVEQS